MIFRVFFLTLRNPYMLGFQELHAAGHGLFSLSSPAPARASHEPLRDGGLAQGADLKALGLT